jgi:hypothetical protein
MDANRCRTPGSSPLKTQSSIRCCSLHLVFGRPMSHLPFGLYANAHPVYPCVFHPFNMLQPILLVALNFT